MSDKISREARSKAARRARENWQSSQRGSDVSRSAASPPPKKVKKDPFAGKNGKANPSSRQQRRGIGASGPFIAQPADTELHKRIGPANPDAWDGA